MEEYHVRKENKQQHGDFYGLTEDVPQDTPGSFSPLENCAPAAPQKDLSATTKNICNHALRCLLS